MVSRILLLVSLFSFNTFAAGYVQSEGRFWAEPSDGLVFIKENLLHNAFVNVITSELKTLGLDSDAFWNKYNEKFEDHFKEVKERLQKKYNIQQEGKTASATDKARYKEEIRRIKLIRKRKFKNLGKMIRSFAIKKMSKAPNSPQSRYISIEAKVDRIQLNKLYYQVIREKVTNNFKNLYVAFEFDLRDGSWSDLGVEGEKMFIDEVNSHWVKWFEKNKPANVENVQFLASDNTQTLKEHLKLKAEDISIDISKDFKDSIAIIMKMNIIKTLQQGDELELNYEGGFVLVDLNTNLILAKNDFARRRPITYSTDREKHELSSEIANFVYRMPLSSFDETTKKITKLNPPNSVKILSVFGYSNMDDILKFNHQLENNGVGLRLKSKLERFNQEKSELVVFYQGDDTMLMNYLNRLKEKSSQLKVKFDFIDPAKPFQVKIIKDEIKLEEEPEQDQESV